MNFEPHRYQRYAITRIIRDAAIGLFLSMGLGKTVITLTAINELKYNRWQVSRCLVIALMVICIILACKPVLAAGQRIVDWPELPWEPDPAEVTALAQTLYGECRGCSELQQRAVCWCIFNRVDDSRFPDTVVGVITQKSQFFGFKASNPVWDSLYAVAYSCMVDWHNGENRVLEPEFCFFTGNGRINIFTTAYGGGKVWAEE